MSRITQAERELKNRFLCQPAFPCFCNLSFIYFYFCFLSWKLDKIVCHVHTPLQNLSSSVLSELSFPRCFSSYVLINAACIIHMKKTEIRLICVSGFSWFLMLAFQECTVQVHGKDPMFPLRCAWPSGASSRSFPCQDLFSAINPNSLIICLSIICISLVLLMSP